MIEWDELRARCDLLSDAIEEWQGVPIPLGEDMPLVLNDRHPLHGFYESMNSAGGVELEVVRDPRFDEHEKVGNPSDEERIVNSWYSRKGQCRVLVYQRSGRAFVVTVPKSPDRSMERLGFWLQTIGAADAWDLDAEHRARDTLRAMLTDRQWRHYDLTGSFFETSDRSRLTYVFRRLRPTIALTPRGRGGNDEMCCLAVLCLHPIGYYARTWGGCLVPTDDVIAHLTWMRGDEAGYWGAANQHDRSSPEAGL